MPKKSAKEDKNPYFLRREELGLTREKASELLEVIPPDKIEKIENERCYPDPQDILIMAEKYKSPDLCNYYCSNQCPIGQRYVPEVEIQDLSRIVLTMIAALNKLEDCQKKLIEITSDGIISDEELMDFIKIQNELERISVTIETLQLWSEQMIAEGKIDKEKYEKLLNLTENN